ncbi:MAG: hypothetical protein K8S87_00175 [Planctomycetes bacterium]|nr:hypothetical protein [Planctomycetota bacterium]
MGGYIIVTYRSFKLRYFPDRTFATPVRPDGLPLTDNSKMLQKQILREAWRFTEEDFNRWKLLISIYFAGSLVFYLLTSFPFFMILIVAVCCISLLITGKIKLARDAK